MGETGTLYIFYLPLGLHYSRSETLLGVVHVLCFGSLSAQDLVQPGEGKIVKFTYINIGLYKYRTLLTCRRHLAVSQSLFDIDPDQMSDLGILV